MPTIAELQVQMATLQKQIEEKQAEGRKQALAEVIAKMNEFGITTEDIDAAKAKSKGRKLVIPAAPKEKVIKYQMGENTWSGGKGPKPKWVKELLEQGKKLEDYLVDKIKPKHAENKSAENKSESLF
jgi:DNA-binding protein H-NS